MVHIPHVYPTSQLASLCSSQRFELAGCILKSSKNEYRMDACQWQYSNRCSRYYESAARATREEFAGARRALPPSGITRRYALRSPAEHRRETYNWWSTSIAGPRAIADCRNSPELNRFSPRVPPTATSFDKKRAHLLSSVCAISGGILAADKLLEMNCDSRRSRRTRRNLILGEMGGEKHNQSSRSRCGTSDRWIWRET